MKKDSTKSNHHYQILVKLWKLLKKYLPKQQKVCGRSLATRWCKKLQNWLAFVYMACAEIVLGLFFG